MSCILGLRDDKADWDASTSVLDGCGLELEVLSGNAALSKCSDVILVAIEVVCVEAGTGEPIVGLVVKTDGAENADTGGNGESNK